MITVNGNSVVFIAFEENENLGVRYMAAVLSEAGYRVGIIDFRKNKAEILEELITWNPLLIGFSVIFEDFIHEFKDLIAFLRKNGIHCHFTAGGHFASLRPADLFELAPTLDSIVRFEGEHTMLDLVNHLHLGTDWEEVIGLSYRNNNTIVNNPSRSLEPDLDHFPYPLRLEMREYVLKKKHTTLLAGRGCIYNCIFCNMTEFYRQSPGPVKRIRNPVRVVEEMEYLHKEHDCSVFLFQDDDFPVFANKSTLWIDEFCKTLKDKDLSGKIMWKINCRPDEIEPESFENMRQHGLFKVFLGIEDGTDAGLLKMKKRLSVPDTIRGITTLKGLGICIDFGFMLFHPDTTFDSYYENIRFLESICMDGYMPVTYFKMLPYLETRIEKELREQGRIKGKPGSLDYDFQDKTMNDFHHFVFDSFSKWLTDPNGLLNMSKWARIYLTVFSFYNDTNARIKPLSDKLKALVSDANRFMFATLKELAVKFESGDYHMKNDKVLKDYKVSIEETHNNKLESITQIIEKIELLSLTNVFLRF